MKIIHKLFAIGAALALAGAAQAAAPAATAPAPTTAAPAAAPAAETAAPEGNAAAPAAAANPAAPPLLAPTPGIGQPDGRFGLQTQVTPIGQEAFWFHNSILLPVIIAISIVVLFLLLFVIVRFRRSANPTPSRNTHNTLLEVAWTLIPVLILVVIAVPSIRLLAHQYSPPAADITVKAIGNQWYWEYNYPDHGIDLVSNMLPDEEATARGEPTHLAVDQRMVVPVGATVKMIVTSNDVIHSWGVPAFWVKMDAVPGRLNETWFRTDRPGVYYGVCYELCGARHGYMPIAVEVVSREDFARWVASQGGHMPGAEPAAAATPAPAPAAAPAEGNAVAATEAPATNQAATTN